MKLFRNIRINKVKIIIWSLVFLILIVVFHNDYSENYLVKVDNVVKVNKAFVLNIKTDSSNEIQSNIVVSDTSAEIQNYNIIDRTPEYVRSIENILLGQFTPVEYVRSPSTDYMNLGFIMINLNSTTTDLTESFKSKVSRTFYSMLQYWDSLSLNLIVITDQKSVKSAAKFIGSIFMRETSMRLITTKSKRWRLTNQIPKVKVHFVNYEEIVAKNRPFVKKLQSVTAQFKENKTVEDDRYMADLFYIAPIYHLALTGIEKMIVIDATDLEFANNMNLLHDQFQQMTNGKLIGLGLDLSPNYYIQLTKYRIFNPDSEVGFPGDTQGFNTGVVLYNLAEMRRSSLYNSYLTPAMVAMLEKKYYYGYTLAEQVKLKLYKLYNYNLDFLSGLVHKSLLQPS